MQSETVPFCLNAPAGPISSNDPDCEVSMWVAAANQAGRRLVVEAFSPIIETLITGGLSPLLSSFLSTSGTLLISETLGLSVRLLNAAAFSILDTEDIPDEAIKTLIHISIGYIAPLLTHDYFQGNKIVEFLLREGSNKGIDTGIQKLLEREEIEVYQDEGSNQGSRWPTPIVTTKIVLVYSPYSHYVTLFLRAGGSQCPDNQAIFVLHYEVNDNGLSIRSTEKEHRISISR